MSQFITEDIYLHTDDIYVDEEGYYVDANGYYVDENGYYIDEYGQYVTEADDEDKPSYVARGAGIGGAIGGAKSIHYRHKINKMTDNDILNQAEKRLNDFDDYAKRTNNIGAQLGIIDAQDKIKYLRKNPESAKNYLKDVRKLNKRYGTAVLTGGGIAAGALGGYAYKKFKNRNK